MRERWLARDIDIHIMFLKRINTITHQHPCRSHPLKSISRSAEFSGISRAIRNIFLPSAVSPSQGYLAVDKMQDDDRGQGIHIRMGHRGIPLNNWKSDCILFEGAGRSTKTTGFSVCNVIGWKFVFYAFNGFAKTQEDEKTMFCCWMLFYSRHAVLGNACFYELVRM